MNQTKSKRLVGLDPQGDVFVDNDKVWRGIHKGSGELYLKILKLCADKDLFRYGIVNTKLVEKSPFPELAYDLVLEHEKIPFISYPHEWSAQMLKDAALFHIELCLALSQYGLTTKDFHPYNILFDNSHPVFVDFTSIIFSDALPNEEYLKPSSRWPLSWLFRLLWDIDAQYFYEMYQRMFLPYFLLPLYLMQQERHEYVHTRLLQTTPNNPKGETITLREVFGYAVLRPWRWVPDIALYVNRALSKHLVLVQRGKAPRKFLTILQREVSRLQPALMGSAYTYYYVDKGENFGFEPSSSWTSKNHIVYESIRRFKPKTVLDVGCNTGWFSILASKMGCQVVALDKDEACINLLYTRAKEEQLRILPLVFDFTVSAGDVSPTPSENNKRPGCEESDGSLLLPAHKRLKCDMVLALAIAHHLVLGWGWSFAQLAQSLSTFSNRYLILEFIPLNDACIVEEPDFFPAYNSHPDKFQWYIQENLVSELKHHYATIEVNESFPKPRTLITCSK